MTGTAASRTAGGAATRLRHRAAWTLADQMLTSVTNAALAILVARSVDAVTFGAFGIAFVVFTFAIGLSRAVVTDPLVIRHSGDRPGILRAAASDAAGTALVTGAAAGALCVAAAYALGGSLRQPLVALALVLPGLLVQDAWRYAFLAAGRPARAALNDLAWAAGSFAAIAVLVAGGAPTVAGFLLAWGGAAAVAAVLGCAQLSTVPRPSRSRAWLARHADLGWRMGADYVISMGAVHVATFVVGAVAGLAAAGAIRAAQTLLGPLQVLFSAATSFALPVLSRRAAAGAPLVRPALATSAVAVAVAAPWVLLLLLLPGSVGEQVLGDSWAGARSVLAAMGTVSVLLAVVIGAVVSLKALARADLLLRVTLAQAPLILVLGGGLGAWRNGAVGAAWGLATAHVVGTTCAWWFAYRVLPRRPRPRPAAARPPS